MRNEPSEIPRRGHKVLTEFWLGMIPLFTIPPGCLTDFTLANELDTAQASSNDDNPETDTETGWEIDTFTSTATEYDSDTDAVIDSDTDAVIDTDDTSPTCDDGVQNGEETGLDCGGICPVCDDPIFSSPTPDISIPAGCFTPNEDIIITKHNPSGNPSMDWIWVPDDEDWWTYMPDSDYQYQAPAQIRSYELKFYWDDAEDKDYRSSLTFKVSNSCP